jgi:hypothetical protein
MTEIKEKLNRLYQMFPSPYFYPENEREVKMLQDDIKDSLNYLRKIIREL